MDVVRRRPRDLRRPLDRRPARPAPRPRSIPSASSGLVFIGPFAPVRLRSLRCGCAPARQAPGAEAAADHARLGQVQPGLLGERRLRRTSSSGGPRRCCPSRTRRSRSRTPSPGATTPTARPSARSVLRRRRTRRPAAPRGARRARRSARCWSSTAPRTSSPPTRTARRWPRSPADGSRPSRAPATCPHARKPVQVNLAIREFISGTPLRDPTVHRSDGRKRALYISSPIGLGHAQRDVGDRARAARPGRRAGDRLAGSGPGHAGAGGGGGADPSGERAPRQRVAPHRVGVRRARPALLPGDPPHGRDPDQQLHGLPRRRARGPLRPLDRRRGVGARLLPAREPTGEAGALRLDDRLRRLAADGRRRRARGLPHRRLQRARWSSTSTTTRACATARSSSAIPRTSSTSASAPTCR